MKNFDINRFGQALKSYFMTSRMRWLRLFGIYTLVMFLAGLFFTRVAWNCYGDLENTYPDLMHQYYWKIVEQVSVFCVCFFFFAMLFGASYIFSHMKETRQRTTFLMWPVSNMEKFLVVLIHNIILMAIGTILSYILADALRVLFDWITGRVIIWSVPMAFKAFQPVSAPWQAVLLICTIMLYYHSLYILGGSLFRRHQFLLTTIAIIIATFFFTWLIAHLWNYFGFERSTFVMISLDKIGWHVDGAVVTFSSVFLLLTAIHYWLSYHIFCRMQVINNKWLNV